MSKTLNGKTALVTGGSRGIGAAIAERLAADGAEVVISYSASPDRAAAVVKSIQQKGGKASAIQADQSDAHQVESLVKEVGKRAGKIDILVNNAGVFTLAAIDSPDYDPKAIERQQAINVGGVVTAVHTAVQYMSKGGRIISIGSIAAGRMPIPGGSAYGATKAAVAAYTRGWAHDLGAKGITVNTVQPGPIDTEMNPDNTDFAAMLKGGIALGRYGKAEEVAAAVAFLASDEASYITGTTLNVDGGAEA
jgi:3-oxoacyl-[acyl-carrier protein] reductase